MKIFAAKFFAFKVAFFAFRILYRIGLPLDTMLSASYFAAKLRGDATICKVVHNDTIPLRYNFVMTESVETGRFLIGYDSLSFICEFICGNDEKYVKGNGR